MHSFNVVQVDVLLQTNWFQFYMEITHSSRNIIQVIGQPLNIAIFL